MAIQPDTLIMWGWRECFIRAQEAGLPILQYRDILEALSRADATLPAATRAGLDQEQP